MNDPRRKSALAHRRALSSPEASIREVPFQGKLVLRGDAGRSRRSSVLSCRAPSRARRRRAM
jgi:hypothetical protein